MDIFIEVSENNAGRLVRVYQEFGFSQNVDKQLFLVRNQILRAGRPPMRLEILSGISGVSFEECYNNRESVRVEDFTVSFINLENLIKNKQATGRSKDKVDVEFLSENLESEQDSDRSLED